MTSTVESPAPVAVIAGETVGIESQLMARTVAIPDDVDIDLLAVGGDSESLLWNGESFGLAGRGSALRLLLPSGLDDPAAPASVLETLRAIPSDDEVGRSGCGPVALGALPFDRCAAGVLTVPAVMIGRDRSGQRWLTTVGPPGLDVAPAVVLGSLAAARPFAPPDTFSLVPVRPQSDWMALIAAAVRAVRGGRLDKVVLAREIMVSANRPFVIADILNRLHALYPSCMVFSTGSFLGASPELLVSRMGRHVRSHPLAGTVARSGDPAADAALSGQLLGSSKERAEHRFVVDEVASALRPVCTTLDVPQVPSIVALRNVSHLGTLLTGRLADPAATSLDLVARLHPTPAVAGSPTAAALAYRAAFEGFDRGCYSGPVGWMDRGGDGEWAVAVRSAEILGCRARLFAGVGVVSDSDPAAELAETHLKLQALLAAIVRP